MNNNMKKSFLEKCKNIRIMLTDVDGVLTDGGIYYTEKGDIMKKFHVRDGMGITLMKKYEILTIIVTKEKTPMVKQWSKRMKIEKLYDGIIQKEKILEKICKKYNVNSNVVAYIGDDVNDIDLLKIVGFSICPNDAIEDVKKNCNYVCKAKGGEGVLREIADIIISVKQGM